MSAIGARPARTDQVADIRRTRSASRRPSAPTGDRDDHAGRVVAPANVAAAWTRSSGPGRTGRQRIDVRPAPPRSYRRPHRAPSGRTAGPSGWWGPQHVLPEDPCRAVIDPCFGIVYWRRRRLRSCPAISLSSQPAVACRLTPGWSRREVVPPPGVIGCRSGAIGGLVPEPACCQEARTWVTRRSASLRCRRQPWASSRDWWRSQSLPADLRVIDAIGLATEERPGGCSRGEPNDRRQRREASGPLHAGRARRQSPGLPSGP